jgi:hypothetical protein
MGKKWLKERERGRRFASEGERRCFFAFYFARFAK